MYLVLKRGEGVQNAQINASRRHMCTQPPCGIITHHCAHDELTPRFLLLPLPSLGDLQASGGRASSRSRGGTGTTTASSAPPARPPWSERGSSPTTRTSSARSAPRRGSWPTPSSSRQAGVVGQIVLRVRDARRKGLSLSRGNSNSICNVFGNSNLLLACFEILFY